MTSCSHLDQVLVLEPQGRIEGCAQCLATGGQWLHLRMCQTCGEIGCCDSSPNQHARHHALETTHPIARSVEPDEDWSWCYVDELAMRLVP
jgi:uncharacterized UBP type Zn finger protein